MDLSGVRVVIPHRGLRDGKARLAEVLSPDERAQLSGFMLDKVARASRAVVPDVVLISPDATLVNRAAELGIRFCHQSGGTGMNHALEQATVDAIADGVRTLAIISADLPEITSADVKELLHVSSTGRSIVTIAPDRAGTGTNALVLRPPDAIALRFGVESRMFHARECARRGIAITAVDRPALGQDIDLPADLAAWRALRTTRGVRQPSQRQLQTSV